MTKAKEKTSLKSAMANQLIRHTTSSKGRKFYYCQHLHFEINSQNWKVQNVGDPHSMSFSALSGEK